MRLLDTDTITSLLGEPFRVGVPFDANDGHRAAEMRPERRLDVRSPGPLWAKWDCTNFDSVATHVTKLAQQAHANGWQGSVPVHEHLEAFRTYLQCFALKTDDGECWEWVFPCLRHYEAFVE